MKTIKPNPLTVLLPMVGSGLLLLVIVISIFNKPLRGLDIFLLVLVLLVIVLVFIAGFLSWTNERIIICEEAIELVDGFKQSTVIPLSDIEQLERKSSWRGVNYLVIHTSDNKYHINTTQFDVENLIKRA